MHVTSKNSPSVSTVDYQVEHDHTVQDALNYYSKWGLENMVFVQPSIYGTDNSCLLDALRERTPDHARGVVVFDPTTVTQSTLREWHDLGVRGVRVNLVSNNRTLNGDELAAELKAYADVIRPFKGWVLEAYADGALADSLVKIVPELGVKFVMAHCGNPKLPDDSREPVGPYSIPGFQSLMTLLKDGNTWIKVSGLYRVSHDPDFRDIQPLVRELLEKAPDRVCWAGDYPHTRFEGKVDLDQFVKKCFEWTAGKNEVESREKLFRRNTEELFDVK